MSAQDTKVNSTPSKNASASRDRSRNPLNSHKLLKAELELDLRSSQIADFDDVLKFNLFLILNDKSAKKKSLTAMQEEIESLERKIDDAARALRAERNNNETQGSQPPDDGRSGQTNENEVTQWNEKYKELMNKRQIELDLLFDECLTMVLSICNDGSLRQDLSQYLDSKAESAMYGPFARLCNNALEHMQYLSSDTFRASNSKIDCRLHVNDPKTITNVYKDCEDVIIKPDVVFTSTVAATDVAHDNGTEKPPAFDKQPNNAFHMRQILGCGELKFKAGSNALRNIGDLPTWVPTKYGANRVTKYMWGDDDSAEPYPADDSAPKVTIVEKGRSATGEPPTKRQKANTSDQHATMSNERAGPSNAKATKPKTRSNPDTRQSSKTKVARSRAVGSQEGNDTHVESTTDKSKQMLDSFTQCALYGMEMLSYGIGVHRSMTFLLHNCKFWMWYYDRQGVIRSNGIDFIKDLPRFLVLLFTLQRFELADWGVMPELNPEALLAHNQNPRAQTQDLQAHKYNLHRAKDRNLRETRIAKFTLLMSTLDPDTCPPPDPLKPSPDKVELDTNDMLHKPHCVAGRATAVVGSSVSGNNVHGDLVCKISFPEVPRQNEGKTIERLHKLIIEDQKEELLKHLPVVVTHGDMARYGTQRIRSVMGLKTDGCRILRIIVLKKLLQITTRIGQDFVKAWLEAVKFHAYLWNHGCEHGDPSLWNLMYDQDKKCGVLSDYDLSIFHEDPRVPGTDRTGTIPFMALDLLTDVYWRGEIIRVYRHELEAFIWILSFVFMRYEDGKAQSKSLVNEWMTSNYNTCASNKSRFHTLPREQRRIYCQPGYMDHWVLPSSLLAWLDGLRVTFAKSEDEIPSVTTRPQLDSVTEMWPIFVENLKNISARNITKLGYVAKLVEELNLDNTIPTSAQMTEPHKGIQEFQDGVDIV